MPCLSVDAPFSTIAHELLDSNAPSLLVYSIESLFFYGFWGQIEDKRRTRIWIQLSRFVVGDGNERDEPVLERIPNSVGSRFRPGSFNRVR